VLHNRGGGGGQEKREGEMGKGTRAHTTATQSPFSACNWHTLPWSILEPNMMKRNPPPARRTATLRLQPL
jgi:hypothetical protein